MRLPDVKSFERVQEWNYPDYFKSLREDYLIQIRSPKKLDDEKVDLISAAIFDSIKYIESSGSTNPWNEFLTKEIDGTCPLSWWYSPSGEAPEVSILVLKTPAENEKTKEKRLQ